MYWAWKLTQCSAWHLRQSTFKYAKQHFTINRGGNRLDRLVKKYDPTLSCEDCYTTPSIWGKFTVFLRVLPDKMTVWGKMWWENSCGGWPRQSRCVCVQGHLLTWHIYNPLSDVWKGCKLGILISKTHIGASNTSQQPSEAILWKSPLLLLLPVSTLSPHPSTLVLFILSTLDNKHSIDSSSPF